MFLLPLEGPTGLGLPTGIHTMNEFGPHFSCQVAEGQLPYQEVCALLQLSDVPKPAMSQLTGSASGGALPERCWGPRTRDQSWELGLGHST
jgi:hypothetical protein